MIITKENISTEDGNAAIGTLIKLLRQKKIGHYETHAGYITLPETLTIRLADGRKLVLINGYDDSAQIILKD